MSQYKIVVFGSLNMDLVANTMRLPVAGETITGETFAMHPGGKGANQAIAVSRLGIPTSIVGRVGNDHFGQQLSQGLAQDEVDTTSITIDETTHTGVALISVDETGQNQIIVIPEANGKLDQTDIERLRPYLKRAEFLLMQLEIPLNIVASAAEVAQNMGVRVILDPAPVQSLSPGFYQKLDIITPNAIEAEHLVDFSVNDTETAKQAAIQLQKQGPKTVIITLGQQGVYCAHGDETFFIPAFDMESVIDTVAAGDAFNAGLAVALCQGETLQHAIIYGCAAGALTTACSGAQSALPRCDELQAFLRERLDWL